MLVSSEMWLIYSVWGLFAVLSDGVRLFWWSEMMIKHLCLFQLLLLAQTPGWRLWSSPLRVIRASYWLKRGCWTGSALSADVFWRLADRCVSVCLCVSRGLVTDSHLRVSVRMRSRLWLNTEACRGHAGSRCQLVLVLCTVLNSVTSGMNLVILDILDQILDIIIINIIYSNVLFIAEYIWELNTVNTQCVQAIKRIWDLVRQSVWSRH